MSAQSVWFEAMVELAESLGWTNIFIHLEDDGDSVDGVLFTSNEELVEKISKLLKDERFKPRKVGII